MEESDGVNNPVDFVVVAFVYSDEVRRIEWFRFDVKRVEEEVAQESV